MDFKRCAIVDATLCNEWFITSCLGTTWRGSSGTKEAAASGQWPCSPMTTFGSTKSVTASVCVQDIVSIQGILGNRRPPNQEEAHLPRRWREEEFVTAAEEWSTLKWSYAHSHSSRRRLVLWFKGTTFFSVWFPPSYLISQSLGFLIC